MMPIMKKEDIKHLAALSRLRLDDDELGKLEEELSSIVEYVSIVNDIAGEEASPEVGVRYNIFRKDEVTNKPDQFTDDILREMPKTDGRYMEVKKILKTDTE